MDDTIYTLHIEISDMLDKKYKKWFPEEKYSHSEPGSIYPFHPLIWIYCKDYNPVTDTFFDGFTIGITYSKIFYARTWNDRGIIMPIDKNGKKVVKFNDPSELLKYGIGSGCELKPAKK